MPTDHPPVLVVILHPVTVHAVGWAEPIDLEPGILDLTSISLRDLSLWAVRAAYPKEFEEFCAR